MAVSEFLANRVLGMLCLDGTIAPIFATEVSLHTGNPGGTGANEVTGGGYARYTSLFNSTGVDSEAENSEEIDFTEMPSCTVTHVGLSVYAGDAEDAHEFMIDCELVTPKVVGAGDTYRVSEGDLVMTASGGNATLHAMLLDGILSEGVCSPALYVSLHTGDPSTTGANEVTGGSYIRKKAYCGAPDEGVCAIDEAIEYLLMPACTVTHAGYWTAATAGTFLGGAAIAVPKVITAGDTFQFPIGNAFWTVS